MRWRLVVEPPAAEPKFPVLRAVTTPDGARDGSAHAGHGDPVQRRRAWLMTHPGGVIGRPRADQLVHAATVGDVEVARAYDDFCLLLDLIDQAEAEGLCPLHPPAGGAPS